MIRQLYFIYLLTFTMVANAQLTQDKPYEFPIKPGTEAWKKFESGQEKKDACQVPPGILQKMSTESLVKTSLSYPLLGHIIAYNDLQTGTESVITEFNGLQELLKRPDVGVELMEVYKSMYPSNLENEWSLLKKGEFAFEFVAIEMLLAQPTVYNTLSREQKKELVAQSLSKFKEKDAQMDVYGGTGLTTSAIVIGRLLNSEGFQEEVTSTPNILIDDPDQYNLSQETMNLFLSGAIVADPKVIDNVVLRAQIYLSR